jgi:PAS domain S-box-containing protein
MLSSSSSSSSSFSSPTSLLVFAANFVLLLVAASGLVLSLLRRGPLTRSAVERTVVGGGFVILGASAFVQGSLLVSGNPGGGFSIAAGVGAVALLLGTFRSGRPDRTRILLWTGAGLVGVAGLARLAPTLDTAAAAVVTIVGALGLALALIDVSRNSIASRVAASGATTLLLVVLVLSVALSAVISSSVQHQAETSLATRARDEGSQIASTTTEALKDARFASVDLSGYFAAATPNPLIELGAPATGDTAGQSVAARLDQLVAAYPQGGFAYISADGQVAAATGEIRPTAVGSLPQEVSRRGLTCSGPGSDSVAVLGGTAWAVAAYAECLQPSHRLLGFVLRVRPLDDTYLDGRRLTDTGVSLALVGPAAVVAASGAEPPTARLVDVAHGQRTSVRVVGDRFFATAPVLDAAGRTVLVLVASSSTSSLDATRQSLFRTLFFIALGGTLLALGAASVIGDRITAGIRRLTRVARSIQGGSTAARSGMAGTDEVGVLGSVFDSMVDSLADQTTALQQAASTEARLRSRLEAVVAGMGDALVATDVDGRITDFNRAAEELMGLDFEAARGAPATEVIPLVSEDGRDLDVAGRMAGDLPRWSGTAVVRTGSGDVPVAVSVGELHGPDQEPVGSVLVLRDLRREREVERMKTEFLSRVGHELRTPLTGIMGYADILQRRDVSPERARGWYGDIAQASKRLLRIVEMLEFFASTGAGRVLLDPEAVDPGQVVRSAVADWSSRASEGHELISRVGRGTPDVLADRRWLALALDELIDNAVKFSPDGGRIVVSARPGPVGGDGGAGTVEISVADRGKGMSRQEQASAFGEFVQGDTSDTRRFGGLGLGLSLVQRVVVDHGGSVTCRSTPGRGSVFSLHLPLAPTAPPPVRAAERARGVTVPQRSRRSPKATSGRPTLEG